MKRVASIFLLSLFLYNIIGYYFAFSILNWQNNSHMSLIVEKSNSLETLRIHKSELKNIVFKDEGKEILFKDEMYDVKSKAMDGDYIVFRCIKDNKEKKLLANLKNNIHNNIDTKSSPEKNNSGKSLKNNISKDYFSYEKEIDFYTFSHAANFKSSNSLISVFVVSLSVPPPEISLS